MSSESPHSEWEQKILAGLRAELRAVARAEIRAAFDEALTSKKLPTLPRKYHDFKNAANHCGITEKALREAHCQGRGPKFFRPGGRDRVLFRTEDLDAWMVARDSNA